MNNCVACGKFMRWTGGMWDCPDDECAGSERQITAKWVDRLERMRQMGQAP